MPENNNNNNIVVKKPPYKESIGAQFYCFNNPEAGISFDTTKYEETVFKSETAKSATVTENAESTPIYASGKVYDTRNQLAYVDISVEALATDADDLARMRGDKMSTNGLIQSETSPTKPYFAYGKIVLLSGGHFRFDWYPKCQLVENSDEAKTRGENFEEQSDTLTIRAYAFDDEGKYVKNSIDSSSSKFPQGVTEKLFFSKPIITSEDLSSIIPEEA